MPEHRLYDHYTDLSSESGFQFEFYCERCGDAWRSGFSRYVVGRWPSAMDAAARVLVGRSSGDQEPAAHRGAAWDRAREAAFRRAVRSAQEHFHRCRACDCCCCPHCWSLALDLCTNCAPRHESDVAVGEVAPRNDRTGRPGGRRCFACARPVGARAFCPHCGAGIGAKNACRSCQAPAPAAARFCPHCGRKRRRHEG